MTSNSMDGTGSSSAYQLQDSNPVMTVQANELQPEDTVQSPMKELDDRSCRSGEELKPGGGRKNNPLRPLTVTWRGCLSGSG
ncbi:eyes absent homolog 4 [Salvelinus sp. IW2-2015]|uniref:eyes absent homolog 4 n=1 Tax=Salvelinus sp. IW2-2015 TaxID=2691554 RepID=UPI000CEAF648|nr:eyes absent homolog 4-like [Salvelinus alpinus]